jgi:hypothetical protein
MPMSTPVPSGYSRYPGKKRKLQNIERLNPRRTHCEETSMKKALLLVSTGILVTILGCSGVSQKGVSERAAAVAPAAPAAANPSPAVEPAVALPIPPIEHANQKAWRVENVKETIGNAVALKSVSLDGKYDLVILERGTHSFLSFVRHTHWDAVRQQPAKGKLMYLRVKFEDGQERRIEWDELGFDTENLYSVLWSYPAEGDAPIGPAQKAPADGSVGGDQLLLQEMLKHKTMLLEIEPGVTTQFDLTGLEHELERARNSKTQPVLEARQTDR